MQPPVFFLIKRGEWQRDLQKSERLLALAKQKLEKLKSIDPLLDKQAATSSSPTLRDVEIDRPVAILK